MPQNITFITTVNHNVGDDFVREGIIFLLKSILGPDQVRFTSIHKHSPVTSVYGMEWLRDNRFGKRVDRFIPASLVPDRITSADLVIQSGAPVYWCNPSENSYCSGNEWYSPLIRRRLKKYSHARLWNIAAGTCQPYFSDGSEFQSYPDVVSYIHEFFNDADLTTLRDQLAGKVLASIGIGEVPVLPCTSIFAAEEHGITAGPDQYVLLNYMPGGAHYILGQPINKKEWEATFHRFYQFLKEREDVAIVCHNRTEEQAVRAMDPRANILISDQFTDYMKFYSTARFSFLNRVHGGFMQASMGKPSLVIGNDSRARMTAEIGIESVFVNDASFDFLVSRYEDFKANHHTYKPKIEAIRSAARSQYEALFRKALETVKTT